MSRFLRRLAPIAAPLALLQPSRTSEAQTAPKNVTPAAPVRLLNNELINNGKLLQAKPGPAVRWLRGGLSYAALEPPAGKQSNTVDSSQGVHDSAAGSKSVREIVRYDAATGERSVLVSADQLTLPDSKEALDIQDYTWSEDGSKLLIFTNTQKVWRQNTRGDYFVVDLASTDGSIKKLGGDGACDKHCLMFAKFNPAESNKVGFVLHNNIFVQDLETMKITQLTHDGEAGHGGTGKTINGNFDWVYEEEFAIQDGWRWSPDGSKIAYWQLDTKDVQWFSLYDTQSKAPYAEVTPYPYPKVGTENPKARIGVVGAAGGETKWMKLALEDGKEHYLARMDWVAKDSQELVVQRVPREQKVIDVLLVDTSTGKASVVHSEQDGCWVDVRDNLKWIDDGKSFTWLSERSGYAHLYVVGRDGSMRDITEELGEADVVHVTDIDVASGQVYFIASPSSAIERYLYRTSLATGKVERVTPDGEESVGTHTYQISPDGAEFAVHSHSSFKRPPTWTVVSLAEHKVVQKLVENTELAQRIAELEPGPSEFFTIDIESDEVPGVSSVLDGWVIFPPGFDKDKAEVGKYPLLVYVYGEPAGCTVVDRFGAGFYFWHLLMAQMGYICVSFDSRGTPSPKGRAWRKSAYKKIGVTANNDQAAAVKALLKKWRFVDESKVGIWGWSGGGSSTLQAMFRFPEVYKSGAAIAFIADQRYYDTAYQERYMGVPPGADGRPADSDGWQPYIEGSPISHISGLRGSLLLGYGTGDDNCHYQNMDALVNELVKQDKYFEMLAYPNRTHAIENAKGPNTRKHLFETIMRFFLRTMPPPVGWCGRVPESKL